MSSAAVPAAATGREAARESAAARCACESTTGSKSAAGEGTVAKTSAQARSPAIGEAARDAAVVDAAERPGAAAATNAGFRGATHRRRALFAAGTQAGGVTDLRQAGTEGNPSR